MTNPLTPIGRISFPKLLGEPKLNSMSGKKEFSVDLLFEKNEDISILKAELDKAIAGKWGAKPPKGLRSPIKDGDGVKFQSGEPFGPEYHGHYFITLKNTRRPSVVDNLKQPIIAEEELYGGCYGRASFNAFAYEKAGNKGVSFSLVNFQKVKDGEPFGSATRANAETEFDVIDEEVDNEANYAPAPVKKKSILG